MKKSQVIILAVTAALFSACHRKQPIEGQQPYYVREGQNGLYQQQPFGGTSSFFPYWIMMNGMRTSGGYASPYTIRHHSNYSSGSSSFHKSMSSSRGGFGSSGRSSVS
jgi:hypothetical protein